MKLVLIVISILTFNLTAKAQEMIPLTFECIETPFHVDKMYETTQMFCDDGVLTYGNDDPCSDIYHENGFEFYSVWFKHENDESPIGTFGDIYFKENMNGETYVELKQARMFIKTPIDEVVNSVVLEIEDISQNGFVFDYNQPSELKFYDSFEDLDEAFPNISWDGTLLRINEPVTEFQIGADHLVAQNIIINPATTTSIFETKTKEESFAFPNPTTDIITFKLDGEELVQIDMFDIQGRPVLKEKRIINSKILVASLYPGTYIIRAKTKKGGIYVQKLTKL